MKVLKHDNLKLSPPAFRTPLIRRPRLFAKPRDITDYKLVVVSAAAGFGKTSLLRQWYQALAAHNLAAGWLTLDRADSDRFNFIASLLGLLRSISPGAGDYTLQLLEAQSEPDLDEVLEHLCSDFAGLEHPAVFFVDEYDWADAPGTNQVMEMLLRHTPEHVAFVIAARSQPGLPMARMRLHNTSRLVAAEDLCFSLEEAGEFLNSMHKAGLSEAEIESVYAKTEGWVAGLQLVMLALRDRDSVDDVLPGLSGEFRDIADYLADDVLEQQPSWLQDFMLRTSVLTRVNAELAQLLTGRPDAQLVLEKLEDANLFLAAMDARRHWYRYHHLFREFLLSRLRRAADVNERELLQRASDWFERNDMPDEAVQSALEAGQEERAAALAESHAENMIIHGQVRQVIGWINRIPPRVAQGRLRLRLIQVWALFHLGRIQQGKTVLQQAEQLAARPAGERDDGYPRERLREETGTLEACLASCGEDEKTIRRLVRNAGEFSADYPFLSGTRANALGAGSYSLGELELALDFAVRGEQLQAVAHSAYGEVMARCLQGLVAFARGEMEKALERFDSAEATALEDTGPRSYCCALARCLKAAVYYYRYDLEAARPLLSQNLPLISGCGYVEIWRLAGLVRARIFACDHLWTRAEEVLRRSIMEQQAEVTSISRALVLDERVRIALRANDLDSALNLAIKHGLSLVGPAPAPRNWHRERCLSLSTQGRLFLARQEPESALRCFRPLRRLAMREGKRLAWIEYALLESAALLVLEQHHEAEEVVIPAMQFAAAEGIFAPFVEEAGTVGRLLGAARVREAVRPGFSETLRNILALPFGGGRKEASAGLHALTERELDVLRLLASGAGNREISSSLAISENTVKWHVRNILEKLGVSNRMKAVLVARESGYL